MGIHFTLIKTHQEFIWDLLHQANNDASVHGIFVYYPIFADARDTQLRNMIAWQKDVEGLTPSWLKKLYANERFDDSERTLKAILPCTPLAIMKILEKTDNYKTPPLPLHGQIISIFNRSEVVGKPLAYMLSNDGSMVYSFDINGGIVIDQDSKRQRPISREQALSASDVVITGVPTAHFHKIHANELKDGAICLNFSHVQNFTEAAKERARCYIPRVGTLTVAMCLRNALRLYRHYHHNHTASTRTVSKANPL